MIELFGNIWDFYRKCDAVVITTNGFVTKHGRAVMGRGCALEAKTRFEGIDLALGRLIRTRGNKSAKI